MSDDSTRTGFGAGYGNDSTRTITGRKLQVRMPSGKIYGPYTRLEVLSFIKEKRIQGEEFILVEGESNWRPITSDTEFFDALQDILLGKTSGSKNKASDKKTTTEDKNAATRPQRTRPDVPKTGSEKSDTRLTNFSEKSSSKPTTKPIIKDLKTGPGLNVEKISKTRVTSGMGTKSDIPAPPQAPGAEAVWPGLSSLPEPGSKTSISKKPKREVPKRTVVIAAALAIVVGGAYVAMKMRGPGVNATRSFGLFQGQTWYSRPLKTLMEGLAIEVKPLPQVIEASPDWDLPEDFGAQAWIEDLKKLINEKDANYKIKAAYWGRWSWDTIWLGSVVRVFDRQLGDSLFKDGLQIYYELGRRKLVSPTNQALFEGAALFVDGKFKEAALKLAALKDSELGLWLAEESAWEAFWQAGAKGQGYRRLKDAYTSPVLDLSSKVRAAFMTRESADFNENLLQLSGQSPLLGDLWFGAAEANWRLRKDGAIYANKMFLTGLAAASLNPGSMQEVYWNQYSEFLGVFGRQSTAQKALSNGKTVAGGDVERQAKKNNWWDLNATDLDVTSLAEEVLGKSGQAMLNPRDLATLYVLGLVAPNGSKYLTIAGQHLAFEGRWLKAADLFKDITKLDPKNPDALGGVVWTNANLYRFGEAFDAHDKFPSLGLQTPEGTKYMGVIQSVGREYDNAEKSFAEYLKAAPTDAWGHYFHAENFLKLERNVDCVKSANLSRIHGAGELKLRATLLFYHCRVLAKMDIKGALTELEALAKSNDENIPVGIEYITALKNADLFSQALEYNRQMLSKYSRSFELRMNLGQLYESRADYDRAVAFYYHARPDRPESAEPNVRIGKIFEAQKKYAEAAQNYEVASHTQPDYPEVYLFAARAYRQSKQADVAAQMYFKEIEARPAVIATFIEAAEFFLEIGSPQEVPKLFQKFQDDFQDDPRVKTRLAQAYLALNDLDKAQENAAAAIAANNKIPEAYRVLGLVYFQQNQHEEANKYFETYLELLPQAADAADIRSKISGAP